MATIQMLNVISLIAIQIIREETKRKMFIVLQLIKKVFVKTAK